MRFNRIRKMIIGGALAAALLFQSAAVTPVYADEEVNAEDAGGEAPAADADASEGAEIPEGEVPAEDAAAAESAGPTVGTIATNNGMYIANTFPDDYLPSGFRKMTVAYQGQNVELAYMDASNGQVTLAYLTDASGSSGDFYLCNTSTAEMSDYVRFDGGNERFIVVMDPGSTPAPDGFEPTALSVNGKSIKAWIYTGETSDDKDKKKDEDKDKDDSDESGDDEDKDKDKGFLGGLLGSMKPVKAYAGELDLGVGSGAGDGGDAAAAPAPDAGGDMPVDGAGDVPLPDAAPADEAAGQDLSSGGDAAAPGGTDGALNATATPVGSEPDPSEYFLVYAMDQSGYQGFYLYDSVGQTYLRYVDLGAGNAEKLEKAQKSAKIRLFIIIGLLVLLIVFVILLINMSLSGRKGDDFYNDDDDDYQEMKRRVEKKSKRAPRVSRNNDFDDYDDDDDFDDDFDDDDDMEDVKVYNKRPDRRRLAPSQPQMQRRPDSPGPRRKAPSQDIDLDDDFSFDFIKR